MFGFGTKNKRKKLALQKFEHELLNYHYGRGYKNDLGLYDIPSEYKTDMVRIMNRVLGSATYYVSIRGAEFSITGNIPYSKDHPIPDEILESVIYHNDSIDIKCTPDYIDQLTCMVNEKEHLRMKVYDFGYHTKSVKLYYSDPDVLEYKKKLSEYEELIREHILSQFPDVLIDSIETGVIKIHVKVNGNLIDTTSAFYKVISEVERKYNIKLSRCFMPMGQYSTFSYFMVTNG